MFLFSGLIIHVHIFILINNHCCVDVKYFVYIKNVSNEIIVHLPVLLHVPGM